MNIKIVQPNLESAKERCLLSVAVLCIHSSSIYPLLPLKYPAGAFSASFPAYVVWNPLENREDGLKFQEKLPAR